MPYYDPSAIKLFLYYSCLPHQDLSDPKDYCQKSRIEKVKPEEVYIVPLKEKIKIKYRCSIVSKKSAHLGPPWYSDLCFHEHLTLCGQTVSLLNNLEPKMKSKNYPVTISWTDL